MTDKPAIDAMNKFGIGSHVSPRGVEFTFMRPIPQRLSQDDALLVAAYIVAMCSDEERWKDVLQAVCNA